MLCMPANNKTPGKKLKWLKWLKCITQYDFLYLAERIRMVVCRTCLGATYEINVFSGYLAFVTAFVYDVCSSKLNGLEFSPFLNYGNAPTVQNHVELLVTFLFSFNPLHRIHDAYHFIHADYNWLTRKKFQHLQLKSDLSGVCVEIACEQQRHSFQFIHNSLSNTICTCIMSIKIRTTCSRSV